MFISYAASTAAFLTAPLLFLIINITFIVVYMTNYQEKMKRINWPCIDFLRAAVSAVIFLILSITSAAKGTGGGTQSAAVFGFILTGVFVYDAYDSYRKIMSDQLQQDGPQSSQSSNLDAE
ncbi:CKLF-like MARVEL transmembrane domain-containing protein 5 [Mustelus asterias]